MESKRGYHHGDLRNALLAATTELVRERGARGFSVSEAARRAGVSSSAPYRHFSDREAMLAAAALVGFHALGERFSSLPDERAFEARAAWIAVSYLRFAQEDPARFETMFASGIDKSRHEDLMRQAVVVQALLEAALGPFLDPAELVDRAAELWSLAHGVATLVLQGNLQHVVDAGRVESLAESAARSWAAGVASAQR
ncbi:transcriptional regulator, TetR family [Lentzea xinjiangensis]|uniref:Transcriptional regulator, TetR family n=1 Tax=Lentzea xinjiangensis TaxID=402600 RepID=A0A1H9WD34_9PSEU|nr:TetR/AcrR family transcriptional regulator [Lentzea xinjiangensis]SES31597.1 transcriptional regulator, TetR family [Lentzea xinjiangensis]